MMGHQLEAPAEEIYRNCACQRRPSCKFIHGPILNADAMHLEGSILLLMRRQSLVL